MIVGRVGVSCALAHPPAHRACTLVRLIVCLLISPPLRLVTSPFLPLPFLPLPSPPLRFSLPTPTLRSDGVLQDRIDDNGWGCAYRSLQTVWSWFQKAHYSSAAVPTHREIQTMLVKLGDKPPSFIGSRQWIGAIELGYVLDDALGVTCKVLTVNSGDDVPSLARSIAKHFDEQGAAGLGKPTPLGTHKTSRLCERRRGRKSRDSSVNAAHADVFFSLRDSR